MVLISTIGLIILNRPGHSLLLRPGHGLLLRLSHDLRLRLVMVLDCGCLKVSFDVSWKAIREGAERRREERGRVYARDKFYTCGECVLDEWCIRDWGGIFILKYTCTICTHSERTGSSPWSRRLLPNHVNYCVSLHFIFYRTSIGCVVVVF